VASGPGAGDDGSAVATLLETARALQEGLALRNDIILLFTDGEEAPNALPGSEAFANRCPWIKDIGCAFNFDARGVSGPVLMYETSGDNGPLIREFARAMPRPVANSLMAEVYRHMPNDTDFTTLKHAGLPGLNFGFIGEAQYYHQPTDVPARLSLRSLQHQGS
jgi:Zn-dependent M28 family amino/carboxypeptidase